MQMPRRARRTLRGKWQVCNYAIGPRQSLRDVHHRASCWDWRLRVKGSVKSYESWEAAVSSHIKEDGLWEFRAYRKALFAHDLAWQDCRHLLKDVRGREVTRQLIRSVGSISANLEAGYGRSLGKDDAYSLSIALAEGRESRGWCWRGRHLLPDEVIEHRTGLLTEIIAMITPNIRRQQKYGAG